MKPLLLCILDGVGIRDEKNGNALSVAKMPHFDFLLKNYPNSKLLASENAVGLPSGQMGNSEVGHINIGTGRAVRQPLDIISDALRDSSFEKKNGFILFINIRVNNKLKSESKINLTIIITN